MRDHRKGYSGNCIISRSHSLMSFFFFANDKMLVKQLAAGKKRVSRGNWKVSQSTRIVKAKFRSTHLYIQSEYCWKYFQAAKNRLKIHCTRRGVGSKSENSADFPWQKKRKIFLATRTEKVPSAPTVARSEKLSARFCHRQEEIGWQIIIRSRIVEVNAKMFDSCEMIYQ